jgi:phosphatidylcholine synthase
MIRKVLAWCVHGYTALGLVAAAWIAVLIYDDQPASYRDAFLLMLIATIIDATDGTLARAIKVKQVLPHFDGRRLDDLIDFQTYTSLPLLLIWRANLLDGESPGWLLAPLVASAYGFCQTSAKTDDGYFLGFPSYWNIIAFYLYALKPAGWFTLMVLLFFAAMTIIPARYLYPTHRGRLNRWTNYLGAGWAILMIWIVIGMPTVRLGVGNVNGPTHFLVLISLVFPAYYLVMSWAISIRIVIRALRRRRHQMAPSAGV